MKCQNCNNAATVHLTEIKAGKKIEKHLCEQCAAQNEGLPPKSHMPINELLTNFVMQHSGLNKEAGTACEYCGITWSDHHIGKVPTRRGGSGVPMKRQVDLVKLRRELGKAIEAEDYERAAKLRDQIKHVDG